MRIQRDEHAWPAPWPGYASDHSTPRPTSTGLCIATPRASGTATVVCDGGRVGWLGDVACRGWHRVGLSLGGVYILIRGSYHEYPTVGGDPQLTRAIMPGTC